MTDYAPNWTPRAKITYRVQSRDRSMTWRIARGSGTVQLADLLGKMAAFLNAAAAIRYTDWVPVAAYYALTDSDVFIPTDLPDIDAGTASVSGRINAQKDSRIRFQGLSDAGGRWHTDLYGTVFDPASVGASDWKVFYSENTALPPLGSALSELAPQLVANDAADLNFYNYVTVKYDDRSRRRTLRGG